MEFDVVIEIPVVTQQVRDGSESGAIWLDRMLLTATSYPADYGFIEGTMAPDGDALDALVLLDEPTFPGCPSGAVRSRCSGWPMRRARHQGAVRARG